MEQEIQILNWGESPIAEINLKKKNVVTLEVNVENASLIAKKYDSCSFSFFSICLNKHGIHFINEDRNRNQKKKKKYLSKAAIRVKNAAARVSGSRC